MICTRANSNHEAVRLISLTIVACALGSNAVGQGTASSLFAPPRVAEYPTQVQATPGMPQPASLHQEVVVTPDQAWSKLPEPLKVAYDCGTETAFQPSVLRFGVLPPPPLPNTAGMPYDCDLPAFGATEHKPEDGHVVEHPPATDCRGQLSTYYQNDFSSGPIYDCIPWDSNAALGVYGDKYQVPVQHPLVEWGFPLYRNGPVPPAQDLFGPTNLVQQKFYVYGDYRVGFAQNNVIGSDNTVLAHRLNLEIDYWITSTERFHMFSGPFQDGNNFMRIENGEFFDELNFFDVNTDTLFFEGDLGQILGGFNSQYAAFDLPFTAGLVPLLFQNGVWMQDAMVGLAATIPAQNSPGLDWSNYDVTFFAAFDNVSTDAVNFDENAAQLFGATTFIESRGGYFEVGYAYVNDTKDADFSYNNIGISYTRRYLNMVSNSMRVILNAGQNLPEDQRTADGVLLLAENTFITERPYNFMPYTNFFVGFDRPQPAARAAVFGGVLFNTGILFQSDALTGYPTLDATGNNTYGMATGIDLLGHNFDQQLIVEVAALGVMGSDIDRNAPGNQAGVGARYQVPITNAHLLRFDVMHGWLENTEDITGARAEFRWKF